MTSEDIAARLAISDVLMRYARGIDRCDAAVLRAVFWPDATTDYGAGESGAMIWCEEIIAALRTMRRTMHSIANILIDPHGDEASAETYCTAYHEVDSSDGPMEITVGGRYLDRFARRGGEWRILRRLYVMDWNRNVPSTANWTDGLYAGLQRRGARHPDDPLYTLGPR